MPTTTTTKAKEHQEQWDEVVRAPSLRDLPYKTETNSRGQIVLSPQNNRHSVFQKAVQDLLDEHAPEGMSPPALAIATRQGVKVPDVAWMSKERWDQMQQTGDPSTLAPEICVEVMSKSNTWAEMEEKHSLYLEAGAEEVWVVSEEGQVRFFGDEEMETSELASDVPSEL